MSAPGVSLDLARIDDRLHDVIADDCSYLKELLRAGLC